MRYPFQRQWTFLPLKIAGAHRGGKTVTCVSSEDATGGARLAPSIPSRVEESSWLDGFINEYGKIKASPFAILVILYFLFARTIPFDLSYRSFLSLSEQNPYEGVIFRLKTRNSLQLVTCMAHEAATKSVWQKVVGFPRLVRHHTLLFWCRCCFVVVSMGIDHRRTI